MNETGYGHLANEKLFRVTLVYQLPIHTISIQYFLLFRIAEYYPSSREYEKMAKSIVFHFPYLNNRVTPTEPWVIMILFLSKHTAYNLFLLKVAVVQQDYTHRPTGKIY